MPIKQSFVFIKLLTFPINIDLSMKIWKSKLFWKFFLSKLKKLLYKTSLFLLKVLHELQNLLNLNNCNFINY